MMLSRKIMQAWSWCFLLLGAAFIFTKGVLPSFRTPGGDFANYYTASRLTVDGISIEPAYRDFVWFQKQIERCGIENQIGSFIPFPPPTALLMLPLAPFEAITAKRIWSFLNSGLVVFNIFLLSKISGLNWLPTAALFLGTGYGLSNNFLFGQQYLLLLASILLGIYLFNKGSPVMAGICFGILAPMKYAGIFFLLYFLWKKQWRLVVAGAATMAAVVVLTLLIVGLQSFRTFLTEVLPRHLQGEIQDPFAIAFQSWNSLFHRLFVYHEILNPHPLIAAPLLFLIFKNLFFWIGATLSVLAVARADFRNKNHEFLFQLGWIPLAALLLAPAGATYHFLLLAITAVFFVKILADLGKMPEAITVGALFVAINLPHYAKLTSLAAGWLTPLAYSRLWLLLIFFVFSIFIFRQNIKWSIKQNFAFLLIAVFCFGFMAANGYSSQRRETGDGARWLKIESQNLDRPWGNIFKSPDLGNHRLVFNCYNAPDKRYAIYATNRDKWTPTVPRNYYNPDLAPDDSSLLAETVAQRQTQIWLVRGKGQPPVFLVEGESPSWHPDGIHFAFVKEGRICLCDVNERILRAIPQSRNCYDVAYSPHGKFLAYCVREKAETSLRIFDLESNREKIVLSSNDHLASPQWSPDESTIIFSWDVSANRDIWAINPATRAARRLTFHRAADDEPIWDELNHRIVFASDRGQGLECSALYWIPIPKEL